MKCTEPCISKTLSKHGCVKVLISIHFPIPHFPPGTVQSTFQAVFLVARRKLIISPLSRELCQWSQLLFNFFFQNKVDELRIQTEYTHSWFQNYFYTCQFYLRRAVNAQWTDFLLQLCNTIIKHQSDKLRRGFFPEILVFRYTRTLKMLEQTALSL